MDPEQFREYIVRVPLKDLEIWSEEAEELLIVIAAHESHLARYVHQVDGPAVGPYQMERDTYWDVIEQILKRPRWRPLYQRMQGRNQAWIKEEHKWQQLSQNLYLATAMARIHFMRWDEKIPQREDYPEKRLWINALSEYAKRRWNTTQGAAEPADYTDDYVRYVDTNL